MANKQLHYALRTCWTGGDDGGTRSYAGYRRDFRIELPGKPSLHASADPAFLGDAGKANPEDLFLSAVSSCHMLFYLALCARSGVCVIAYDDRAEATLDLHADGGGAFSTITLRPTVTVSADSDAQRAHDLHARAGDLCFIARSCSVTIRHAPVIVAGAADR